MLYHEAYPHGGDRYSRPIRLDFSANTHPLGPDQAVVEAIRRACEELDHYPDPYCSKLVSEIAETEGVPEGYLICGNGAADLIDLYVRALRPHVALIGAPTFAEYRRSLEGVGCGVMEERLWEGESFDWTPSLLDRLERERPDLLVLCHPNNPTGRLVPPDLLTEILRLCQQLGIALLLDECFIDLADRYETRRGDLAHYPEMTILHAFTKDHGLAGLRLGYCMTADSDLLSRMSRLSQPWNVSLLAQRGGVAAAKHPEYVTQARALVAQQRPTLMAGLKRLGMTVIPSEANFLLFRGPVGLDRRLVERQIAIRSCANYSGLGEGWYRTAVRREEENRELLSTIEEILLEKKP